MRSSKLTAATLLGIAALAMAGTGTSVGRNAKHSSIRYRPTPPKMDTDLAREIAEHNAAVERRKVEKRAAKGKRRRRQAYEESVKAPEQSLPPSP